jgi:hypothetical protein
VLVLVVVLVLDLERYWFGERKAVKQGEQLNEASVRSTCQPIKKIDNEDEDEHD